MVSLAAALSIPLTVEGSAPFPGRDLVLFATFCVILATLVGQGAALPGVIAWLGLDGAGRAEAAADKRREVARIEGVDTVLARLDELGHAGAPAAAVAALRRRHRDRRAQFVGTADERVPGSPVADDAVLEIQLVEAERLALARLHAQDGVTDEARRRIEREFDLAGGRARPPRRRECDRALGGRGPGRVGPGRQSRVGVSRVRDGGRCVVREDHARSWKAIRPPLR